jgi:hypothetical protein
LWIAPNRGSQSGHATEAALAVEARNPRRQGLGVEVVLAISGVELAPS